jgi:hypothetical protein
MISIKFLFKDSKSGRKGEVPSLFNQKKSKYSIFNSLIHKVYQRAIKPPMVFIKFQKQVPLFNGPKSREKHPRQAVSNCKAKKGFFSQCCILV